MSVSLSKLGSSFTETTQKVSWNLTLTSLSSWYGLGRLLCASGNAAHDCSLCPVC